LNTELFLNFHCRTCARQTESLVSDILETTELALDDEINSDLNSPLSRSFVTSETMKISVGLTDLSNDLDVILKVDGEILAGGDERGHRTCGNGIPRH
jgi:hypothetical protein